MTMNLPFEANEPFELNEAAMLSGGVVVGACIIAGNPALLFRFAKPDGTGFYPATLLCCDRQTDLEALVDLVREAVQHAIRGATS